MLRVNNFLPKQHRLPLTDEEIKLLLQFKLKKSIKI
jgi:hypothetical protein